MKYLYIEIEVREGEYEHNHRVLHTTNCKSLEFAVEWYTAHFWGYGSRDFDDDWWWWNGEHCGRTYKWKELTKEEYEFMNRIMYN